MPPDTKKQKPHVSEDGAAKAAERQERLAKALRDNLRRRKGGDAEVPPSPENA